MKTLMLLLLAVPFFAEAHPLIFGTHDLIYGKDDRYEVDEFPGDLKFIDIANSVAMRVSKRRLVDDRDDETLVNFPNRKLKSAIPNLCAEEKFLDQPSVGDCSGFLVGKNILATAGHCLNNEDDCSDFKWVFDFKNSTKAFKKENVYSCKRIITRRYEYSDKEVSDYALIELDRETDRPALEFRKQGKVNLDTRLVVIGHPLGLPMKITNGGRVSKMNNQESKHFLQSLVLRHNYFTVNLDTYGGNSGSPVLNEETGIVEGILIQGAEDFEYNEKRNCVTSRRLSDSHKNTFEKVMRINRIKDLESFTL